MMPGGGVRKAAASSSREQAAGRGGSPTTFSTPRDLPRGSTGAQAKPDNVADVRRPQGANFPFLPHMVIGRRVPSLVPGTPPPPPPEVPQLPTDFHVPIPRDLPPGPWLPDEMSVSTTELSRREDSDDQDPSSEGGFQRNLWHERRNGVSVIQGDAIFSMNRKNPSSLGRDRRSKVNNGGVGYQKRTTGSIGDIGTDGGRFCNRSKDNDKPAAYDRIPKMHAMSNRHYEPLQKLDLQNCQRQVTRKTQPIVQRNPLLDSMSNQKVKGQWVAVTKDENHNLEAGKQNDTEVKDDNSRDGFSVNDIDQDDSYFDERTKEFLDGNKIVATPDSRSYVDLISDAMEGNPSKTELENEEEMEELLLKLGDFAEEELLDKLLAEPKDKSSTFKNAGVNPVGKDLVSSSSRRSFRRGVHCRFDIEDSTPGFLSVYRSLVSPAEQEKCKQNQLLRSLTELVKEEWPNAQLHLFGSCANSFGLPSSDVDVCLSVDDTVMNKQNILLKLADILRSKNFLHVEAIANARVPIVKMIDPETEISCDICINNLLAVANTKLLRDYAQIDDRLHQLAFIVKQWAKARGVNDTYQGTLSSYAYVLMCIHFLQLRNPAILPCLQEMKVTYFFNVDGIECAYFDRVETLHDFGSQNNESIARLVWEFFHYWAYSHDYINHVVSVRTGKLISKRSKNWTKKTGKDRHLLCIEDPFETSHDLGRAVDMCTLSILREEFERAADILQCDPNPWQVLFEVDSKQYGA